MSLNRHVLDLSDSHLADVEAGQVVRIRSDKDMYVALYSEGTPRPAAQDGVATCYVSASMIDDLRREGHTGIVPSDSPYIFGLQLAKD